MTSLRKTTKDLLALGVPFMFLWGFVWGFVRPVNVLHSFAALFVPYILLYIIRRFAKKGYVFIVLTLSVLVGSWFVLSGMWITVAVLAVLVAYLLYSVHAFYYFELEPGFSRCFFYFVVFVFMYSAVSGGENPGVYQMRIIVSFLLIVSFAIIYHHMDNLDVKLYMGKDGRATRRVLRVNNAMSLMFIGIVSIAGISALFFPINQIFGLFIRFFRWLFSWIPRREPDLGVHVVYEEVGFGAGFDFEEAPRLMDFFEFRGPGIITAILEVIGIVLVIAAVLHALYVLARKVKRTPKAVKLTDTQEEVALTGSIFDDLRELMPKFRMFRHPVRRAYEKKVNFHIKKGVVIENHDTTDKIADKIRKTEDIDELTAKYVVVRYGSKAQ